MKKIKAIAFALLLLAAASFTAAAQTPMMNSRQAAQEKSLYQRVGGYDAIAAVVDDFVGRLVADKQLARFFEGHSTDSLKRIRQHIVDQFCAAAGGPCLYVGRDMKTSHQGLGITEAQWDAAAKHLIATLDKFKVPAKETNELVAFVTSLKKDIVEK
ncbi:MAG: group 1 truncated hemoglobin [Pyrinomonadaceae bacterium]